MKPAPPVTMIFMCDFLLFLLNINIFTGQNIHKIMAVLILLKWFDIL